MCTGISRARIEAAVTNCNDDDRRPRRKQGGEAGAALRFFKAPPRGCGKSGKRNSKAAQPGKQSAQWAVT